MSSVRPKKLKTPTGNSNPALAIAKNIVEYFSEGFNASIVEIRDLPLYDFDYDDPNVTDKPTPPEYTAFRETTKASDGVLFVTPENNRTIPAALKNAVDIGSKPNADARSARGISGPITHAFRRP